MKRNCGWKIVAAALLVPALAYGAGDIVLEGITATDAFARNGDVHVRFATSAPVPAAPQGVCDVTLVNVFPYVLNNQIGLNVQLKANCGAQLTSINWLRNGVTIQGEMSLIPSATGDVHLFTSPLFGINGTNVYTAVGNGGRIPAGASAIFQF